MLTGNQLNDIRASRAMKASMQWEVWWLFEPAAELHSVRSRFGVVIPLLLHRHPETAALQLLSSVLAMCDRDGCLNLQHNHVLQGNSSQGKRSSREYRLKLLEGCLPWLFGPARNVESVHMLLRGHC